MAISITHTLCSETVGVTSDESSCVVGGGGAIESSQLLYATESRGDSPLTDIEISHECLWGRAGNSVIPVSRSPKNDPETTHPSQLESVLPQNNPFFADFLSDEYENGHVSDSQGSDTKEEPESLPGTCTLTVDFLKDGRGNYIPNIIITALNAHLRPSTTPTGVPYQDPPSQGSAYAFCASDLWNESNGLAVSEELQELKRNNDQLNFEKLCTEREKVDGESASQAKPGWPWILPEPWIYPGPPPPLSRFPAQCRSKSSLFSPSLCNGV